MLLNLHLFFTGRVRGGAEVLRAQHTDTGPARGHAVVHREEEAPLQGAVMHLLIYSYILLGIVKVYS